MVFIKFVDVDKLSLKSFIAKFVLWNVPVTLKILLEFLTESTLWGIYLSVSIEETFAQCHNVCRNSSEIKIKIIVKRIFSYQVYF